ncbi:MAG: hypothetical protein ACLFQL_00170 [Paracoccaceae bacterium]
MDIHLPPEIRSDLDAARRAALRRRSRMRVEAAGQSFRVLRLWRGGFSVEAGSVPVLRGLVDLYDGGRHLGQCLIVASDEDGGELRFEFKRNTAPVDRAPVDFVRDEEAPIALLPDV